MRTSPRHIAIASLAVSVAAGASAGIAHSDLYRMTADGRVTVEFLSSNAGATGSLYFLGSENPQGAITYAASTDSEGLGMFLFSNKGTPAGAAVDIGTYNDGDILHFAYLVTHASGDAKKGDVSRTDIFSDGDFYQFTSPVKLFDEWYAVGGVEDIVNRSKSDFDHNDMLFGVRTAAIPAPGAGALAVVGGVLAMRRQRRATTPA